MARYRVQVARARDTLLPRDQIVNVLYFDSPGALLDAEGICEDIGNAFLSVWYSGQTPMQVDTRLYEAGVQGPPLARKVLNTGVATNSSQPREVALCLSFYAGQNVPRKRGRIFLDPKPTDDGGVRPSSVIRERAIALGQALSGIGGPDIDWGVYSPTSGQFNKITNLYCDDEWDTQRSRGLRSTTRTAASTSG